MSTPIVSILLPSLNQNRFLKERFESILSQSLADWELLVNDGFSDDGSWETIAHYANQDRRIQIWQSPRRGPYEALNSCLARTRGAYVYIATADDTLRPNAIEELVAALEERPDCDVCHSVLKFTNEKGEDSSEKWEDLPVNRYFKGLLDEKHVRYAPHDGLLHCSGDSVFTSLAQLLVRRTVFERFGGFRSEWGAVGDFEWGMRVGLVCNVLHIPRQLATWRRHSRQLTALNPVRSPDLWSRYPVMIEAALEVLRTSNPNLYKTLNCSRLTAMSRLRLIGCQASQYHGRPLQRLMRLLFLATKPPLALEVLRAWPGRGTVDTVQYMKREMGRLGVSPPVPAK